MNKGQPRNLLFFLSPRFVDFDTYLPIAMELAAARPEWRIRFVIFHTQNYQAILANHTMMAGLGRCGSIHYLGSGYSKGIMRLWRRLCGFALIAGWILRHARSVLFLSRPFSRSPYSLFFALSRLRGGHGHLLWKHRSPDEILHLVFQTREPPKPIKVSLFSRLLGCDLDTLIHFHDRQEELGQVSAFGRIHDAPRLRIGLPQYFRSWRKFIDDQIEVERGRLAREGVPRDSEIYTVFAAKTGSGANIGVPGASERSFRTVLTALCRLRPDATVLIRAHPQAMDDVHIKEAIEAAGSDHVRLTFAHPEVLAGLSRRCIATNQTNILFAGYAGRFMDCGEYPEFHFRKSGEVSLAHGYGPLYINPLAEDFDSRFARALEDDFLFDAPELTGKMDVLNHNNPPRFEALLELLDGGCPPRASLPEAQNNWGQDSAGERN